MRGLRRVRVARVDRGVFAPGPFLRRMKGPQRRFVACWLAAALCCDVAAQEEARVYRLRPWADAGLCVVGLAGTVGGLRLQEARGELSVDLLNSLDVDGVPAFDRASLRIDPTGQDRALVSSDLVLNICAGAPLLLVLDKRVRREWIAVAVLYAESALLTGGIQTMTTSAFPRYRPITYLTNATLEQRQDYRNVNAFYSGHTANTAVATFFMAKVIDDLHPELGGKRWFVYGAALVPPALVGYYRIQGGKHFPSDVLMGALMGGAAGYLVPHLHRRTRSEKLSVLPFVAPAALGAHLVVRW
jgi:PAP2 superfamily